MKNLGNIIPGLVNTGLSLLRDKKGTADTTFVGNSSDKGISLSAKRVFGYGGGATLITYGVSAGDNTIIMIGAALTLGMGVLSYLTEKK